MNPESENKVCSVCNRVNQASLNERPGKLVCGECWSRKEKINEFKMKVLSERLIRDGVTRPSAEQIMMILDLGRQQALAYGRVWKARHMNYYTVVRGGGVGRKDAICQAIAGEQVGTTTTPELTKMMKDAEKNDY
jgi:hypothetical protein